MNIKKLLIGAAAGALMLAFAMPTIAADTTLVIRQNNLQGWSIIDDNGHGGSATFVNGPTSPPMGNGSLEFNLTASNQGYIIATQSYVGTPLSAITKLNYWSYQSGPTLAVALQFDVRYHPNDTVYQGRLVFEPYQNGAVTVGSGWQEWNPLNGKWWASKQTALGSNGLCPMSNPCSWSDVKANWPDASILGNLLFKAGSGWSSFQGNVDGLTVGINDNNTIYDFEMPLPTFTVTISKYLDGQQATSTLANGALFPMVSSWVTTNINSGSGSYQLGPVGFNNSNPYQATTSDMAQGATYSTSEVTDINTNFLPIGAGCERGKYRLVGYTSGVTMEEAKTATLTSVSPTFTDITSNQYVIVWNESCIAPQVKDDCKNGGWTKFNAPPFKNQGDCVSWVQSNPNATGNKTK